MDRSTGHDGNEKDGDVRYKMNHTTGLILAASS